MRGLSVASALLTFLLEPALMALRRLAQENESTARHVGDDDAPARPGTGTLP
ncbi:hypothetical protein [Streptomyces edwardsiae]|uniref:Uncharacterized protein n=1 Tax=Streptomyces edwardsiae TaxID=3075527 RepID=A0ABU2Q9S7_9ACTN|nr:hypothetical protein [Streptomyces sp. DSM 41635]MDT0401201.1 hypothetical protein [Streptomyces sp. DSM 41635]